jgi:hypothetical protein
MGTALDQVDEADLASTRWPSAITIAPLHRLLTMDYRSLCFGL